MDTVPTQSDARAGRPASRWRRRSVRRTASLVVLAGMAALSGCAGEDEPAAPAPPDLTGRTYLSTGVEGHELVTGTQVQLGFTENSISAKAGCNRMFGQATWKDGVLVVGEKGLASTKRFCDLPLQKQDIWLSEFLTSKPALSLSGTALTLQGESAAIAFEERVEVGLEGPTWKLSGMIEDGKPRTLPPDVDASIQIEEGGTTMAVRTGCNSSAMEIEHGPDDTDLAGTLGVNPGPITLMACEGPVREVETFMLSVLKGKVAYEVSNGVLKMTNGDRELIFTTDD